MPPDRPRGSIADARISGLVSALVLLLAIGCGSGEPGSTDDRAPGAVELETSPEEGASRPAPTAAETCLEMAVREDWARALDPCTRAAQEHPEDPDIQHALESAQAAGVAPEIE